MKKLLFIIAGLLIIGTGITGWQLSKNKKSNTVSTSSLVSQSQTDMSSMQKQFEGYKGVEFDKVFMASMIVHHQGAIQMAELALINAKHQEIKDLAKNIINSQNKEITEMQALQKTWGYLNKDNTTTAVDSQMQSEMDSMMTSLNGKTGDTFDQSFLAEMMPHHQSAIDMSKPAATNAYHQQVKTLASNIITAQSSEISQMMQWQSQWGYQAQSSMNSMPGMHM